jgi:predicted ATP-grasp superfamily ATP-dependent carboligase
MFDGYFNEESECLFGLTANMIRQYPPYKGVTSLGVCITNDTVAEQTKAFMKAIGYRGPLDIGHKYDKRSGHYKTIDVNPRIGTTFRLLVDDKGMDVARALYLDLTDQTILQGEAREGRKWVVENFDLVSAPIYCRDNKQGIREWVRSYKGLEEASWFARDDFAPFLMVWWRSFQWAFEKLFTKVLKACMRLLQVGRMRQVRHSKVIVDTQISQSVDSPTTVP